MRVVGERGEERHGNGNHCERTVPRNATAKNARHRLLKTVAAEQHAFSVPETMLSSRILMTSYCSVAHVHMCVCARVSVATLPNTTTNRGTQADQTATNLVLRGAIGRERVDTVHPRLGKQAVVQLGRNQVLKEVRVPGSILGKGCELLAAHRGHRVRLRLRRGRVGACRRGNGTGREDVGASRVSSSCDIGGSVWFSPPPSTQYRSDRYR